MTIASLLKTSRPRFWIYLVGPIAIAFAAADFTFSLPLVVLFVYATLPANLLIYGVNDIFDRDTDALNNKKSGYEQRLKQADMFYLVFWIIALNLPLLLILTLTIPTDALLWIAVFLVLGVGYSAPPIRAKSKPFLDAAFNLLYVALGFATYILLSGMTPPIELVIAAGCWCAAMHAYSAVPDIQPDRQAGLRTIATTLGSRWTLFVCCILYVASAALSFTAIGYFVFIAVACYVAMMILSLRTKDSSQLLKVYAWFPLLNTIIGMCLWFWIVFT